MNSAHDCIITNNDSLYRPRIQQNYCRRKGEQKSERLVGSRLKKVGAFRFQKIYAIAELIKMTDW